MPKQSISFSAGSYITDPPFPPDRMTYVIYHMGPSQTTGRGGDAGSVRCSSSCSWYSASQLVESTADLARGRGRREEAGERGWLGLRGASWAEAQQWFCACLLLSAKPPSRSAFDVLPAPARPFAGALFSSPFLSVPVVG